MVTFTKNSSSHLSTLKKVLYHPLSWLALGLHALLLVVPLNANSPAAESEAVESEAAEDIPIDILNLSEIATSTPPPANAPSAGAPTASAPPTAPRTVAAAPSAALVSPTAPTPAASSYSQAPSVAAATGSATTSAAGSPASSSPAGPSPAYDPTADQGVFISGLQSLGVQNNSDTLGLPNDPKMFRRPSSFSFFLDNSDPANVQAIAGVREAQWLEKQVSDLLPLLQSTYAGGNLTFTEIESYGGEPLYEIKTAQGQIVMYVSLVDLKGSSLLITWNAKPV